MSQHYLDVEETLKIMKTSVTESEAVLPCQMKI